MSYFWKKNEKTVGKLSPSLVGFAYFNLVLPSPLCLYSTESIPYLSSMSRGERFWYILVLQSHLQINEIEAGFVWDLSGGFLQWTWNELLLSLHRHLSHCGRCAPVSLVYVRRNSEFPRFSLTFIPNFKLVLPPALVRVLHVLVLIF